MPEANWVVYLSGGNPQITKADGDAPVQAYIAAKPEWKSDIGRRLDEFIVGAVTCNSAIVVGCPRQSPQALSPLPPRPAIAATSSNSADGRQKIPIDHAASTQKPSSNPNGAQRNQPRTDLVLSVNRRAATGIPVKTTGTINGTKI